MTSVCNGFDILVQRPLGDLERRRRPRLPSPLQLLWGNAELDGVLDGVDGDDIAVLHQRDGPADLGFGYDVADAESVRSNGRIKAVREFFFGFKAIAKKNKNGD